MIHFSRFDLIFLLLDPQSEVYDRQLAHHLVSMYYQAPDSGDTEDNDILSIGVLKDYIAYARNYVHPKLSEEAGQSLIHAYVEMRKVGAGHGRVTAYPRQLESLIRLAEAHAKVRLSPMVQQVDVDEAIRLHREAIKQAATDPTTGKIDASILTTGLTDSHRKKTADLAKAIRTMLQAKRSHSSQEQPNYDIQTIHKEIKAQSASMVPLDMFQEALRELENEGFLLTFGGKFVRITL